MQIKKYILFIFVLLLFSCVKKKEQFVEIEKESLTQIEGVNVVIDTIILQNFQKIIVSNGNVTSSIKSEVHFKTNERIANVKIKNGQKVTRGDILATLENEIQKNRVSKAQITLDKAKMKFEEEKINYGLEKQNESTIDPIILRNLHIRSGYQEAINELKNAQLLYNQTFLYSPISGVVANLEFKRGTQISSNDVFCTIINQTSFEIVFLIQENELNFIKEKQYVDIIPFAYYDKSYQGIITEINPQINKGLVKIKAKINGVDNFLYDGMNAKIHIKESIKDIIVIPKEALVLRDNKEVVFTVENGFAKWNYVDILYENNNKYAIKKGLKPNDLIIVSGNANLVNNSIVKIINNK